MSENTLKKQLKKLKKDKGVISRQVGIAKKNGEDSTHLIAQVKEVSNAIKSIEAQLKESKKQEQKQQPNTPENLPPQFSRFIPAHQFSGTLKVCNTPSPAKWDQYVNAHPSATFYHSWAIKELIEKTFHHPCHYFYAVDENDCIQGVLPLIELKSALFGHFLVSVPFFNYGSLLYSNLQAKQILIESAAALAKSIGAQHIEYRDCYKMDDLPSKSSKVTMLLNLPDSSERLWKQLGTKLRAQIKKSQRYNLQVKIGRQELVTDFYKVFAKNMRDLGTPVYSKNLFKNLLNLNESARIIVLYYKNKPVSCGFLLGWRNTLEIPWASTLRSANKLDSNMNMYWEILKYAIQQGYQIFDFGRSSPDANTYKFKKQWGAEPHLLHWHYWIPGGKELPEINPNNPKYKIMISVWKKMPVWLTKLIGPPIVKNLP